MIEVRFQIAQIDSAANAFSAAELHNKTVVVLDVLRATTTIIAALEVGVKCVRAFASIAEALSAAENYQPKPILCGEVKTLRPPGFDLGNSPRQFNSEHSGKEIFLATTNGTRALNFARGAKRLFCGSLTNASAVARAAADALDILMICAGTDGQISQEDILGAGAIGSVLAKDHNHSITGDSALIALRLFESSRNDLPNALRQGQGGKNLIAAGLEADINYCAKLDASKVVGIVDAELVIQRFKR